MPPLDDWLAANDRRLTKVYLGFFSAVPEVTVVATLNALSGGFGGARPRHPVLDWIPVISQLQKTQFNGATAHTVLQFMTSGAGALTGSQLLAARKTSNQQTLFYDPSRAGAARSAAVAVQHSFAWQ